MGTPPPNFWGWGFWGSPEPHLGQGEPQNSGGSPKIGRKNPKLGWKIPKLGKGKKTQNRVFLGEGEFWGPPDPPGPPPDQVKRKILVLDLDETLIHSHHDGVLRPTVRPGTPPDFILKVWGQIRGIWDLWGRFGEDLGSVGRDLGGAFRRNRGDLGRN